MTTTKTKILIIEDDPLVARVYASKYTASEFETCIAADGREGLDLIKTFKPDLVHLDLLIPKANGVQVIRAIRSDPRLQDLPIIVLSNTYQNSLVKQALESGATECVSKATCTPKMMVEKMEKLRDHLALAAAPALDMTSASSSAEAAAAPAAAPAASQDPPIAAPLDHTPDPSLSPSSLPAPMPFPVDVSQTAQTQRSAAFQAEIRRDFLRRAPKMIEALQARLQPLLRAPNQPSLLKDLAGLRRATHSLASQAGISGLLELAEMASAIVALLGEVLERPKYLGGSVLRTVVDAADFLAVLLARASDSQDGGPPPIILVVDDEALSRRAVVHALAQLNVATVAVDSPQTALTLLAENRFSLVCLDVGLPDTDGFELCKQIRATRTNQATPVVFVTALDPLLNQDRAFVSGGNDIITKPFLPMELAVKSLSLLRRSRGARPSVVDLLPAKVSAA